MSNPPIIQAPLSSSPSSSSSSSPPNWLGLLKWSLAYSDGTTNDASKKVLTEDEKKWLKEALNGLVKDEPERMKEIIALLNNYLCKKTKADVSTITMTIADGDSSNGIDGSTVVSSSSSSSSSSPVEVRLLKDEDEVLELLEELRDIVDQIDMALVFVRKLNGLNTLFCFIECTNDHHDAALQEGSGVTDEMKILCTSIIATLSQNNPAVQEHMYTRSVLERLSLVAVSTSTSPVMSISTQLENKILMAISCLIRNHCGLERLFVEKIMDFVFGKVIMQMMTEIETANSNGSSNNGGGGSVNTAAAGLVKRIVFLGQALLASDFKYLSSAEGGNAEETDRRDEKMAQLFIPSLLTILGGGGIRDGDLDQGVEDKDFKELILQFLSTLATIPCGRQALVLHSDLLNQMLDKIGVCECFDGVDGNEGGREREGERDGECICDKPDKKYVEDFHKAVSGEYRKPPSLPLPPIPPNPNPSSSSSLTTSTSTTATTASTITESTQQPLLLEPAPLSG